ncbi:glycosyltransferase [Curtobacterium sp. 9128]|uniref:glycosyltransferase n=1 Tax=Curtobacterium sp. 9128 TaxID=1793722 RepID=UPI0011A100CD|nr:glycosyltransferase [Curtobacterium sp. 9128]
MLVLHNVVEHDGLRSSNPVVDWIRLRSVRKFPSVLVHGRTQQRLLATQVGRVAAWSDLPADSYAEWLWCQEKSGDRATRVGPPAFLCLGEIRANKGIETAIGAARLAGVRLSVRGKGVDEPYLAELRRLAANSKDIAIVDSFMSPVEFSDEIDASLALVIPYTSFEAQSGPLAKGMARGKWILSSQLPSLMDQAKGYPSISFFGVGDEEALAELMRSVVESGTTQGRPSRSGQDPAGSDGDAWDATIEAVLTDG